MTKIKNILKTYFSNKQKSKIIGTLGLTMIFLGVVLSQVISFANLTPVKSITITSENLSYEENVPGSWKIIKSAKWISKGKAQITFELDTLVKTNNIDTDVILVLDTSGSMSGERLDKLKTDTTTLITSILGNENNNVALITFDTESQIISDFTQNSESLIESINNLEAIGNTNYYQALVNVDSILKNYTKEENKDCIVLFLTDGYPNIDSPNEIAQYNYLKTIYTYLTINSIQYEMGEEPLDVLKEISDNQYNANIDNLETYLHRASISPLEYEKFEITDYIDEEYFTVADFSSIRTSSGRYTLENNKITWILDKINSGSSHKITIDITLNDGLSGIGEVFPTNEKTIITSKIEETEENITTEQTPRLADTYKIIYEENAPDDCVVSNMPLQTTSSVYNTVKITTEEPICEGYKFKEWEIVNKDIEKINNNSFIMPEDDVVIRATWTRLSSIKSMDGKISKVQTLYQMMSDNSTPDNISSEFVSSATGINFSLSSSDTNGKGIYQAVKNEGEDTPIYYYRGAVENNNLIFANFCWKIVRTTETKGIKLIYNGIPNEDGSCNATGSNSMIGTAGNSSYAISSTGYMYGNSYSISNIGTYITGIGQRKYTYKREIETSNYIYASTVTYDEETGYYTLINGENRIWNDTYSVDTGNKFLYTCLSETENKCKEVYYILTSNRLDEFTYTWFSNGETLEKDLEKKIIYGNDVLYNESTKQYILQDTLTVKIGEMPEKYEIIGGVLEQGYHYTCLDNTTSCETVNYISQISMGNTPLGTMYYVKITNGKKIDDIVKEMTSESTNENSSNIKTIIDTWYENNMTSYTSKLEDTIWCNDRTIGNYGTWNKNGSIKNYLYYESYYDYQNKQPVLLCRSKNDAFTVDDTINGNGKLKYPIALLTMSEVLYAGNGSYIGNETMWWTMTPSYFANEAMAFFVINPSWMGNNYPIRYAYGIRPSISLKAETRSIDGDGTPEDPFIVE